jgi:predicted TIM-barrel fold metal-dependent hydrolase
MTLTAPHVSEPDVERKLAIIDVDFHPMPFPTDPQVAVHLSARWRDYLARYGVGSRGGGSTPPSREFTHRLDAVDEHGRVGIDPALACAQVLDPFDMTAVVLTCPQAYNAINNGVNMPDDLVTAWFQAYNNMLAHTWLAADPRFRASVVLSADAPGGAAEIQRCKEGEYGDRFVQVLVSPAAQEPLGRKRYWEIFEACEHYDIPLAFHVAGQGRQQTGSGSPNYYSEMHAGFAALPMAMLPSFVFNGVFERFPRLKLALLELGWDWVVPYSWRLDSTWMKLREEVPHIQRPPSDYLREHCWFSTQPLEEPEHLEDTGKVFQMFEDAGFADRLMFSSDYPHWDFDSPYESVPETFPEDRRRRILGENASALYGIALRPDSGIPAHTGAA